VPTSLSVEVSSFLYDTESFLSAAVWSCAQQLRPKFLHDKKAKKLAEDKMFIEGSKFSECGEK